MASGPVTPRKSIDICVLCGRTLDSCDETNELLSKSDYKIAFETITGLGESPGAVCNSCKDLLLQYNSSNEETKNRIGVLVRDMATNTHLRQKRCAPSTPTQESKRRDITAAQNIRVPGTRKSLFACNLTEKGSAGMQQTQPSLPASEATPPAAVKLSQDIVWSPDTVKAAVERVSGIQRTRPTQHSPSGSEVAPPAAVKLSQDIVWSPDTVKAAVERVSGIQQTRPTQHGPPGSEVAPPAAVKLSQDIVWSPDRVKAAVERVSGIQQTRPTQHSPPGSEVAPPAAVKLPKDAVAWSRTVKAAVSRVWGKQQSQPTQPSSPVSEATPPAPAAVRSPPTKRSRQNHPATPKGWIKVVQSGPYPRSRILEGPWKRLGQNLVRGHYKRIPKTLMDLPDLKEIMVKEVLKQMDKECTTLSRSTFNSVLRQTSPAALKDFRWVHVMDEWKRNAPIFLKFLQHASNALENPTTHQTPALNANLITMAMGGAVLLKARSAKMSAPMYINSLILRQGGAKKRCIQRLNRLGICMSNVSTLITLKEMAKTADGKLVQWKQSACQTATAMHNPTEETRDVTHEEVNSDVHQEVLSEESCSGITFDVSEITFASDKESNCSDKGHDEEEEEETEEEKPGTDSEWEQSESDIFEEEDLDSNSEFEEDDLDSELPVKLRQLCPDCGAFFYTSKCHTCEYKIKPYSCNVCGKRCVDKKSLKSHSRIHKETYKHFCKFCLAAFQTRLDKLAHEKTHARNRKPYQCPDCSLTFSKITARNLHLKDHRGPKIFSCPHCNLEFTAIHYLERHAVVHTGVKPFVCEFCSRTFNQAGHLKSHMRLHTGEKPFQCQHCDKSFNHNVSLKSHVMRYHSGASDSESNGHIENVERSVAGEDQMREKEEGSGDDENMSDDHTDQAREVSPLEKGPMKGVKTKSYRRSSGRPKGRPKRNAALGDMSLVPAVSGEAQIPSTAAKTLKVGRLKRTSPKDIESNGSDGDSTLELSGEDEREGSKQVRESKRWPSKRPKNFDYEDYDSDSDFDPSEIKKSRTSVQSLVSTGGN